MIAGPNGSGKTTLTRHLISMGIDFGRYINADDIAAGLEGDYALRVARAQVLADEQRTACLEAGVSFSFETVMSHPSKIDVLKAAQARGYVVALYFVATERPELNVERVRQRVAEGGHDVPEDRIAARYHRTLGLLPAAIRASDFVSLFDNSQRARPGEAVRLRLFLERDHRAGVERSRPPLPAWWRKIAANESF